MKNFSPDNEAPFEKRERELVKIVSDFAGEDGERPVIEVDKKAPGLFLFDIDGTIVDAKRVHAPAALALFKEIFGGKTELPFDDKEFADKLLASYYHHWGLGDRKEFELVCRDIGVSFASAEEQEKTLDTMTASYGAKMEEGMKASSPEERRAMIQPGVLEFLEEMKTRKIPAALVTGNGRRSAEAMAKYLGFGQYFLTGGYDDDPGVSDEPYRRANILKSAVEKCREKGLAFTPEQMAVFGDTPKDFQATLHEGEARPHVFLLATGDHGFYDLTDVKSEGEEKRPHLVVPSFKSLKIKPFFDSLEKYRK